VIDQSLLARALTELAHTLVRPYEIGDVLYQLTDLTVDVLGLAGAGVSLEDEDGTLRFITANSEDVLKVEVAQEEANEGACHEAYQIGQVVVVEDVAGLGRWPAYEKVALEVGLRSVAGIPMGVDGTCIGALNLFDAEPRRWTDEEVGAAVALADMATSLVLNARELKQSRQLTEQLQKALDSRAVIEQAKGIVADRRRSSVEQAFQRLRDHARRQNLPLHAVARGVVDGTIRRV
jgi:GAF domain-containing protein